MKTDIFKRLREARLSKGVTQAQLGLWAGMPQAQVSRVEAEKDDVRLSSLLRLLDALDLALVAVPKEVVPQLKSAGYLDVAGKGATGKLGPAQPLPLPLRGDIENLAEGRNPWLDDTKEED
jgi:transcriptional regulator with XRE-family HTH domain